MPPLLLASPHAPPPPPPPSPPPPPPPLQANVDYKGLIGTNWVDPPERKRKRLGLYTETETRKVGGGKGKVCGGGMI